jgi:hypothetical protein
MSWIFGFLGWWCAAALLLAWGCCLWSGRDYRAENDELRAANAQLRQAIKRAKAAMLLCDIRATYNRIDRHFVIPVTPAGDA